MSYTNPKNDPALRWPRIPAKVASEAFCRQLTYEQFNALVAYFDAANRLHTPRGN